MDDKRGNQSRNRIANHGHGASISGGSMNNPMYREVHSDGVYQRASGRCKRRIAEKQRGASSCKHKKFWEL